MCGKDLNDRAEQLRNDPIGFACLLVRKWFPGKKLNETAMVEAMALDADYWENHMHCVRVGTSKAFNGEA